MAGSRAMRALHSTSVHAAASGQDGCSPQRQRQHQHSLVLLLEWVYPYTEQDGTRPTVGSTSTGMLLLLKHG
jgi:hypothetical protein